MRDTTPLLMSSSGIAIKSSVYQFPMIISSRHALCYECDGQDCCYPKGLVSETIKDRDCCVRLEYDRYKHITDNILRHQLMLHLYQGQQICLTEHGLGII